MTSETPEQPKLDDLLSRYLQRQREAQQAGLAVFSPGDVTPYEAGPVQPIDPKLAWDEAALAIEAAERPSTPPGWPQLVAAHEPVVAVAFAAGNFPQLMRNFHTILHKANLADLRPQGGRATPAPALEEWARKTADKGKPAPMLMAVGALRLAKQFDQAEQYVAKVDGAIPATHRAAWENEKAALAWHKGESEKARDMWYAQKPSVPVLFNRGMADLFLGRTESAAKALAEVVQKLPETSAWHHLAQLYLTLAQGAATR